MESQLFPLKLRPLANTDQLVAEGQYEYFNPLINNRNFPTVTETWFPVAQLVCFSRRVEIAELCQLFEAQDLRPANMTELLTFRIEYPGVDLTDPIVAPSAILTKPDGQRFIGCLFEFAGEPNLGVIWERQVWSARYRFLVVSVT